MSPLASPSERGAALRAQREADEQFAQRRQIEMSKQIKTATGIVRKQRDIDSVKSLSADLHQALGEAIDLAQVSLTRQEQLAAGQAASRAQEARRAPALENPRGVTS